MGVPTRMRALQDVFFFALLAIGIALRCKVCGEDGHCTKDDPYGVSTECPEDKNGCYYSMSKMMNKRKCIKVKRDMCVSWMLGEKKQMYCYCKSEDCNTDKIVSHFVRRINKV